MSQRMQATLPTLKGVDPTFFQYGLVVFPVP